MKHTYLITDTAYRMLNQASFLEIMIDMTSEDIYKPKLRFK